MLLMVELQPVGGLVYPEGVVNSKIPSNVLFYNFLKI